MATVEELDEYSKRWEIALRKEFKKNLALMPEDEVVDHIDDFLETFGQLVQLISSPVYPAAKVAALACVAGVAMDKKPRQTDGKNEAIIISLVSATNALNTPVKQTPVGNA